MVRTSGVVTARFADPGALLQSAVPVVAISQVDKLRVYAYVGQSDAPFIQLGMPVVVAKPQSRAAESLVEMAYAMSGVRQQQAPKSKEASQKGGFFSRIMGNVPEDKAEVGVE